MRIKNHPILDFKQGEKVSFTYEDKVFTGFAGEPIAAALHDNGIMIYRHSIKHKRARGFFCAIGHCSSCFMIVDGKPNVMTCVTPLKEGMKVQKQRGKGKLS